MLPGITEIARTRAVGRPFAASIVFVLTMLFGVQLLRSLITGVSMYLYEAMELPALLCAACGLASIVFAFAILRGVALLGDASALTLMALGVVSLRSAEQLSGSPAADLLLASLGVSLWISFVPLAATRAPFDDDGRSFALGLLCAIALDTTIKGSFETMDLSWVRSRAGYAVLGLAVGAHLVALARGALDRAAMTQVAPVVPVTAGPLVALGPILLIELVMLQNIGQHAIDSGLSREHAFLFISSGNAAALLLASRIPLSFAGRIPTVVGGVTLAVAMWFRPSGGLAVAAQLAGVLLVAQLALAVAVTMRRPRRGAPRLRWPTTCPAAVGLAVGLSLVFWYYASYEIELPFGRRFVLPLAALTSAAAIVGLGGRLAGPGRAARHAAPRPRPRPRPRPLRSHRRLVASVACLLLVAPLHQLATQRHAEAGRDTGLPIRVMTFNLHNSFDPRGAPSIERIADMIERRRPDVVALQEVSRAWLVTGSFDNLEWLSRRLDMPYVWGPSVDQVWGNAVLSRLPMRRPRTEAMPNNDQIHLDRAFTRVDLDVDGGRSVRLFVTHLHAVRDDGARRIEQIDALIAAGARAGANDVVLLGDLNFRQWDPEFDVLSAAGLGDAFTELSRASSGTNGGFTTRANVRIDYIWTTPTLRVTDVVIGSEFASDHLPLSATITR
jgi:endonuclease/exonuclease/phosphatase family metal-dependent hydrolase